MRVAALGASETAGSVMPDKIGMVGPSLKRRRQTPGFQAPLQACWI
ncbi:hypothetical protein NMD1_01567 [Novosphingobium sp. MD-1]|nr:hypothetical protein NMD1_01567 [Novosphingobium sp. MD-1]